MHLLTFKCFTLCREVYSEELDQLWGTNDKLVVLSVISEGTAIQFTTKLANVVLKGEREDERERERER